MDEQKLLEDIQELINQAYNARIETSVPLAEDQLDALQNLNEYCVNIALTMPEVIKRPLKVAYKANEEFKTALVAICLSYALVNPRRKMWENKEFFDKNIYLYPQPDNVKFIDFGQISDESVQTAVCWDIVEDWKLYNDRDYGGIKALMDEKTNLAGLDDYLRGGDRLYEFARFQRKFTEKERKKEEKQKDAAKMAFRNAVMQSVASEVTKQQLLEGKNPLDIIDNLLNEYDSRTTPQIARGKSGNPPPRITRRKNYNDTTGEIPQIPFFGDEYEENED